MIAVRCLGDVERIGWREGKKKVVEPGAGFFDLGLCAGLGEPRLCVRDALSSFRSTCFGNSGSGESWVFFHGFHDCFGFCLLGVRCPGMLPEFVDSFVAFGQRLLSTKCRSA